VFSPRASRQYNIDAVFSASRKLQDHLRSFKLGAAMCFSYPLRLYREEALAAGRIALDAGRLPPWLDRPAPGAPAA